MANMAIMMPKRAFLTILTLFVEKTRDSLWGVTKSAGFAENAIKWRKNGQFQPFSAFSSKRQPFARGCGAILPDLPFLTHSPPHHPPCPVPTPWPWPPHTPPPGTPHGRTTLYHTATAVPRQHPAIANSAAQHINVVVDLQFPSPRQHAVEASYSIRGSLK